MNIALNRHFEVFIAESVASGRFKSSSEVVREGLRLLEEREIHLAALRRKVDGRQAPPDEPSPHDADFHRLAHNSWQAIE